MHDSRAALLVSDERQTVLPASGSYGPYGWRTAASVRALAFNGRLAEGMTGCYHLGHGYRVYSPSLRRFHSPDRWSPFAKGGLNAYAYCAGDPVNQWDPSGAAAEWPDQLQRLATISLHVLILGANVYSLRLAYFRRNQPLYPPKVAHAALGEMRALRGGRALDPAGPFNQIRSNLAGYVSSGKGLSPLALTGTLISMGASSVALLGSGLQLAGVSEGRGLSIGGTLGSTLGVATRIMVMWRAARLPSPVANASATAGSRARPGAVAPGDPVRASAASVRGASVPDTSRLPV